ncbi:hypothetical protein HK098_005817 [Nowakowskiella sp. JEL0407]|nr:hypothetical protein HK098_005817 [Nowakowskiella sp. JEL0407]
MTSSFSFPTDKPFLVKNLSLSKVLGIPEGSVAEGADVVVEDERSGSLSQLWTLSNKHLVNCVSKLAISISGPVRSGSKLIQAFESDNSARFEISDAGHITVNGSSFALGVATGFFAKKEGANVTLQERKKIDNWNDRKEQRWEIVVPRVRSVLPSPPAPVQPAPVTTTTTAIITSTEKLVYVSLPSNVWFLLKTSSGSYLTVSEAKVGASVTEEPLSVKDYETQLFCVSENGQFVNKKSGLVFNATDNGDIVLSEVTLPAAESTKFSYTLGHQILASNQTALSLSKSKLVTAPSNAGDKEQNFTLIIPSFKKTIIKSTTSSTIPSTETTTNTITGPSKKKISTSIQTKHIEGPFETPSGFPPLEVLPENPDTGAKPTGFLMISTAKHRLLIGSASAGLLLASLGAKVHLQQSWKCNELGQLENTATGEILVCSNASEGAELQVVPASSSISPESSQWILTEDDAIALKSKPDLVIAIPDGATAPVLQKFVEYLEETPEDIVLVQRFTVSYALVVRKEVVVPGEKKVVEESAPVQQFQESVVETEVLELDDQNLKEAQFSKTGYLSTTSIVASKGYARFPDGWFFIYFKSQGQTLVLDIDDADVTKEGARLVLNPILLNAAPGAVKSQLWTYSGGFLINWASGLAMDVKGGYVIDDAYVVQSYTRAYRSAETQHWGAKSDGTIFLLGNENFVFSIADETTLNGPTIIGSVGSLIFGSKQASKDRKYLILNQFSSFEEASKQAVGYLRPVNDGDVVISVEEVYTIEIDSEEIERANLMRSESKRWTKWVSNFYSALSGPRSVRIARFPEGAFFIYFASWGENFVLTPTSGSEKGGKVILRPIDRTSPRAHYNQLWSFTSAGTLINYGTGLVLDVSEGKFVHGTKVILWKEKADKPRNQIWALSESGSILLRASPKFVIGVASPFPAGDAASALRIYESDSIEARRQTVGFLYPQYVSVEKKEEFTNVTVGEIVVDENAVELSLVDEDSSVTTEVQNVKITPYSKTYKCTRVTLRIDSTVTSTTSESQSIFGWFTLTVEQKGIVYALDIADGVRAVLRALSPSTYHSQLWRFTESGHLENMKYGGFLTAGKYALISGSAISLRELGEDSALTQTWYISDTGYVLLGPDTPLAIQSPEESDFNDDPADDEFEFVPVTLTDITEVIQLLDDEKVEEERRSSVLERFVWAPKTVHVKKIIIGGAQSELLTGSEFIDAVDREGKVIFGKETVISKVSKTRIIKRKRYAIYPGGLFLIYFISQGKELVWSVDATTKKVVLVSFDSKSVRNQLWTWVDGYLKHFGTGLTLEVAGASINANAELYVNSVRPRTAAATQLFGLLSSGHIFPLASDTSVVTSSLVISDAIANAEKDAADSKIGFLAVFVVAHKIIEKVTVDGTISTVTEELRRLKLKEKRTWLTSDYALLTRRNVHYLANFPRNAFFISFASLNTADGRYQVLQSSSHGEVTIGEIALERSGVEYQLWKYEGGTLINSGNGKSLTLNGDIEEKTAISLADDSAFAWGLTTESTIFLKAASSFFIVRTQPSVLPVDSPIPPTLMQLRLRDYVLDATDGSAVALKKFNIKSADSQLWRWESGRWVNKKYGTVLAPSVPLSAGYTLELVEKESTAHEFWRVGRNAGIVLDAKAIKLYIGAEKPEGEDEVGKIRLSDKSEDSSFGWGFRIPTFNKRVIQSVVTEQNVVKRNVVRIARFPSEYFFIYLVSLGKHYVLDLETHLPNSKVVLKRLDLQQPASQLWKEENGKLVNKLSGLVLNVVSLQQSGKVIHAKAKTGKDAAKQSFAIDATDNTILVRSYSSGFWVLGVTSTSTLFSKTIDVLVFNKTKIDEAKSKFALLIPQYAGRKSEKIQSVQSYELVESTETWSPEEGTVSGGQIEEIEEDEDYAVTTITTYDNETKEIVEHEFQEEQVVVMTPEEHIQYLSGGSGEEVSYETVSEESFLVFEEDGVEMIEVVENGEKRRVKRSEYLQPSDDCEIIEVVENGVKKIVKRVIRRVVRTITTTEVIGDGDEYETIEVEEGGVKKIVRRIINKTIVGQSIPVEESYTVVHEGAYGHSSQTYETVEVIEAQPTSEIYETVVVESIPMSSSDISYETIVIAQESPKVIEDMSSSYEVIESTPVVTTEYSSSSSSSSFEVVEAPVELTGKTTYVSEETVTEVVQDNGYEVVGVKPAETNVSSTVYSEQTIEESSTTTKTKYTTITSETVEESIYDTKVVAQPAAYEVEIVPTITSDYSKENTPEAPSATYNEQQSVTTRVTEETIVAAPVSTVST